MTTYFITKYAFPNGHIRVIEIPDDEGPPPKKGWVLEPSTWQSYKVGRDIHLTVEDAVKYANNQRRNMIVGLQAKIDALQQINFSLKSWE